MKKIESALFDARLYVIESALCKDETFKERYIAIFETLTDVISSFDDNPSERLEVTNLFQKHLEKIESFR